MGRLSDQVRLAPHSIDSKNLLEHHPPQCQELHRTNENTMEGPNRPLRTDLLGQGPIGHEGIRPLQHTVNKGPPTLQAGGARSFPPSPHELLELFAHPIVTSVHLQYQTAACRAITSEEGTEPGYNIVCFVVRKTISKLECVILTTLFLPMQKTPITIVLI
jgi:hypothetical protein